MPNTKSKSLLVLTTVAKKSDALNISKILIKEKLTACVTTLPAADQGMSGKTNIAWKRNLYF